MERQQSTKGTRKCPLPEDFPQRLERLKSRLRPGVEGAGPAARLGLWTGQGVAQGDGAHRGSHAGPVPAGGRCARRQGCDPSRRRRRRGSG